MHLSQESYSAPPNQPIPLFGAAEVQGVRHTSAAVLATEKIEGLTGFFNAAAWSAADERDAPTMLLGRRAERGKPGHPDIGSLVLAVVSDDGVESLREVWEPGGLDSLEDPRVWPLPDGSLRAWVTRVCPEGTSYKPMPAFFTTTTDSLLAGVFPDTHHVMSRDRDGQLRNLPPGKNALSLGLDLDNADDFGMYRPDHLSHGFLAFRLRNGIAEDQQVVELAAHNIPHWASWKIGLTKPPIWLNNNEALLVLHGISMQHGRYRYSMGSGRLYADDNRRLTIDNVSVQPDLTPESFEHLFPGEQVELHPEQRQALYMCGGTVRYDALRHPQHVVGFVNVGDTRTVKATFSIAEIIKNWDRSAPHSVTPDKLSGI